VGRHESEVERVCFNHAGDLLASYGSDKVLSLWMLFTGRQLSWRLDSEAPSQLLFSADDTQLGLRRTGSEVGFWQLNAAPEYRVLTASLGLSAIESIGFSPDGKWLAAVANEGIAVWEAARGSQLQILPEVGARSALFDPISGDLLASGTFFDHTQDNTGGRHGLHGLRRWRLVHTGPEVPPALERFQSDLGRDVEWGQLAFASNGTAAVTARSTAGKEELLLFHLNDRTNLVRLFTGVHYQAIAISGDGRYAAAQTPVTNTIQIWDLARGVQLDGLPEFDTGQYFAFSPSGEWFVTTAPKYVQFWRAGSWEPVFKLRRSDTQAGPVAFSRDGRLFAMADSFSTIQLFSPKQGTNALAVFDNPDRRRLRAFAFSPDSTTLAAVVSEQLVLLWDLALISRDLSELGLAGDLPLFLPPSLMAGPTKGG
jgi:WD40 repeat protein